MERYVVLAAVLACLSCAGGKVPPPLEIAAPVTADNPVPPADGPAVSEGGSLPWSGKTLEEFTERERSGAYVRGMGIAESVLREDAGDYAGAVLAAYKELAWMYSYGLITKEALEQGLKHIITLKNDGGEPGAAQTARGLLAFLDGQWEEAENILASLFGGDDEPDSFARWLLLACALEKNPESRTDRASYGAIRARYSSFPEYWYRGARTFSGVNAAQNAERCINLAPTGPFAEECRRILAVSSGLDPRDGASLKSLGEIEALLTQAVSTGNPGLLSGLLPLIALPDNPYTVFTAGALRALAELPQFGDYFEALEKKSSGRLAERLRYIRGGRG
ncbi:MAG: hypothetical protein LBE14_02900 [Treponema sp.]|jgi:hypothetical protein|nr:hypothetical protein [Treponema sp.]